MNTVKLIASDLDGTLLTGGRWEIPQETLSLIKDITDRGIVFAVASGRQYENLYDLFGPIRDKIAYICYNGGLCVYQGRTIYENFLDRDLALEIIRDIESRDGSNAMVSVRGYELISRKDPAFYTYMTENVKAKVSVKDDLFHIDEDIFKAALYNSRGELDTPYWERKLGNRCKVLTSGNVWLDFIPERSDKKDALGALCDALRITCGEVVAFGDSDNDIGMLSSVGYGISMSTARDDIKHLAKRSVVSVDEVLIEILSGTFGR